LTRRLETYHEAMLRPAGPAASDHASIHEIAAEASDELKRLLVVDDRPRASAVDRFLLPDARAGDLMEGRPGECGDFFDGRYSARLLHGADAAEGAGVTMSRDGAVCGDPILLTKTIRADRDGRRLLIRHRLSAPDGAGAIDAGGARFALELNLGLIESEGRLLML